MLFNSRERSTTLREAAFKHTFPLTLVALAVHVLVNPALAQAAEITRSAPSTPDVMVVNAASDDSGGDQQDYSVKTTTAGTKLLLTPRDVPQSLSVITQQRMQDQNLQTVGDVLNNTTGVSPYIYDSERSSYYSRGFIINNYTFDGIPTSVNDVWNFGDAGDDTAIYDRIEVVRGATGLMTGAGNPSASVNMVRKQADSKDFTGNISASYGSWNKQRYVLDVSGPLNQEGTVRGRVVAGYQDQDSWLDRYHRNKKFIYGVVDADVSDSTTLSLGYSFQEDHTGNPTWGGLPSWYSNGNRTHYSRSTSPSADWAHYDINSRKIFANLTHNFDNGWNFRLNATHAESKFDDKLLYAEGFPDEITGEGVSGYGSKDRGTRRLDSVDTYASGPFELLGRQHQMVAGVTYSRQHNVYSSAAADISSDDIGDYNNLNGKLADPQWSDWEPVSDDIVRQKAVYTALRFSLTDPLSLIVGARYTQYSTMGTSAEMTKNNITPYAGVVYDINDTWSAYASYTSIFQPQSYRDESGNYLAPTTGKNYETGLKSAWLDGRLTATFAVFRIEQDNLGQEIDGGFVNGTSEQAYYAAKGVVSKGAEFELNGAVTDNLQMTFGATRYVATDATDGRPNAFVPQTTFKLFSRYTLPMLPQLTVGGGINWQNRTYQDAVAPSGDTVRIFQSSYPLASLFARYQVTKQLALQANIDNLFDRTYYSYLSDQGVYGEPRSATVSVSYSF